MANLIFIVGATAVGKTDLALELAKLVQSRKKTPVGILNGDSIQLYKELNIGSAKPDFSSNPYINFYLFNELKAPKVSTAGFFRKKALEILNQKLPTEILFLVGGSGFYLQALEKGMYPVKNLLKKPSDSASYSSLLHDSRRIGNLPKNKSDTKELYKELAQKDPKLAVKISPNDKYRILRALSLIKTERKTVSQIKKEFKEQRLVWPYLKIGLQIPKEQLLKRVQQRTQVMLKKGLIEETQDLVNKGFKNWRPLNSIGYKEVLLYLDGKIKKEELESDIVSKTMKLAKKQKTWFKKDKNIRWFDWNLSPLKVYKQLFQ